MISKTRSKKRYSFCRFCLSRFEDGTGELAAHQKTCERKQIEELLREAGGAN